MKLALGVLFASDRYVLFLHTLPPLFNARFSPSLGWGLGITDGVITGH